MKKFVFTILLLLFLSVFVYAELDITIDEDEQTVEFEGWSSDQYDQSESFTWFEWADLERNPVTMGWGEVIRRAISDSMVLVYTGPGWDASETPVIGDVSNFWTGTLDAVAGFDWSVMGSTFRRIQAMPIYSDNSRITRLYLVVPTNIAYSPLLNEMSIKISFYGFSRDDGWYPIEDIEITDSSGTEVFDDDTTWKLTFPVEARGFGGVIIGHFEPSEDETYTIALDYIGDGEDRKRVIIEDFEITQINNGFSLDDIYMSGELKLISAPEEGGDNSNNGSTEEVFLSNVIIYHAPMELSANEILFNPNNGVIKVEQLTNGQWDAESATWAEVDNLRSVLAFDHKIENSVHNYRFAFLQDNTTFKVTVWDYPQGEDNKRKRYRTFSIYNGVICMLESKLCEVN